MDVDKIFSLFDNDDSNAEEKTINNVLIDFTELPEYSIRMFIKSFLNSKVLGERLSKLLEDTDIDDGQVTERLVYYIAWKHLSKLDMNEPQDISAIQNIKEKEFDVWLNKSLEHFESEEEYEKCAFICKIKNLREKDLEI